MNTLLLLIPCLIGGLGFAAIAAWLMSQKGNTIRDTYEAFKGLESQKIEAIMSKLEAVKLDILGKIKLSSNVPTVALFVVAAIVAIAPLATQWTDKEPEPLRTKLVGTIDKYDSVVPPGSGDSIHLYRSDMAVTNGSFEFPISAVDGYQSIVFESPKTSPVTLGVEVNAKDNQILVYPNGSVVPDKLPISGQSVHLPWPVTVVPLVATSAPVQNTPTQAAPVDQSLQDLAKDAGSVPGGPQ